MSDLIERLECFDWACPNAERIAKEAANEIARLRGLLGKVFRELDTTQSPGHHHSVVGAWDDDNGDLSGKPCEWCATWSEVRLELVQKP